MSMRTHQSLLSFPLHPGLTLETNACLLGSNPWADPRARRSHCLWGSTWIRGGHQHWSIPHLVMSSLHSWQALNVKLSQGKIDNSFWNYSKIIFYMLLFEVCVAKSSIQTTAHPIWVKGSGLNQNSFLVLMSNALLIFPYYFYFHSIITLCHLHKEAGLWQTSNLFYLLFSQHIIIVSV